MMSKGFEKLLSKKKDGADEMSDNEKEAKMGVVSSMRDMASKAMSDKLGGLKKVSVASDSPKGLEAGLDKAKEMLGSHDMSEGDSEDDDTPGSMFGEGDESGGIEDSGDEKDPSDMSEDELDAKLQELMAIKAHMQSKK